MSLNNEQKLIPGGFWGWLPPVADSEPQFVWEVIPGNTE